jgi:hypothetical protein
VNQTTVQCLQERRRREGGDKKQDKIILTLEVDGILTMIYGTLLYLCGVI